MKKNYLKLPLFAAVIFSVGMLSNISLGKNIINSLNFQLNNSPEGAPVSINSEVELRQQDSLVGNPDALHRGILKTNKNTAKDTSKNPVNDTARKVKYLNDLEKDVILEINKVRTNPVKYAKVELTMLKSYYEGNIINYPGRIRISSHEGIKAVDECINVLLKTKPMGRFVPSEGLSKAAKDVVKNQSLTNNTGHYGSDGSSPFDRMNRYGKWLSMAAENIDYGYDQADSIVMSLLIDDGVADRGHRKNILNNNLKVIGVASGKHKLYRNMFVMDFANGYKENK